MNIQEATGALPLVTEKDGSWETLRAAIEEVASKPGVKGIMALACDTHGAVPESFDRFLRTLSVPIFGGVFPGLISNSSHVTRGNIVLGLRSAVDVYLVPSLSDAALNYDEWLAQTIPSGTMPEAKTMFVLVDGRAPRVGALIESLFNTFGLQGNFIGGGAGSLTTPQLPCLITGQGVMHDAAILAMARLSSQVSVAHGWLPIAGPFEVTSSENNVVLMLDWEPAVDVYRRALEAQVCTHFDFAALAQAYPFGIARLDMEFVVRDPVAVRPDGALIFVGDVPRGSLVHIMNGNVNSLLAAAAQVRARANAGAMTASSHSMDIVMDCISRALFLGEQVSREIQSLHQAARPLIGAFTLGEIANSGQDYLEFHNKTAVVATIWE